jgi:sugar phosphate isomerase/epimerase
MKIGVQLYTVREELSKDFIGTLEKISQLGYQGVEFAGFGGIEANEMKKHLDRLNLEVVACHTKIDALEIDFDAFVAYNQIIGNNDIVIAWSDLVDEVSLTKITSQLLKLSTRLSDKGMRLHYHNHSHEYKIVNDKTLMEQVYEQVVDLKPELDLFWIKNAKLDPLDHIKKYTGRIRILHLKDMLIGEDKNNFAAVGEGVMDYKTIIAEAKKAGVEWLVVENDAPQNGGINDISISISNINQILK